MHGIRIIFCRIQWQIELVTSKISFKWKRVYSSFQNLDQDKESINSVLYIFSLILVPYNVEQKNQGDPFLKIIHSQRSSLNLSEYHQVGK